MRRMSLAQPTVSGPILNGASTLRRSAHQRAGSGCESISAFERETLGATDPNSRFPDLSMTLRYRPNLTYDLMPVGNKCQMIANIIM